MPAAPGGPVATASFPPENAPAGALLAAAKRDATPDNRGFGYGRPASSAARGKPSTAGELRMRLRRPGWRRVLGNAGNRGGGVCRNPGGNWGGLRVKRRTLPRQPGPAAGTDSGSGRREGTHNTFGVGAAEAQPRARIRPLGPRRRRCCQRKAPASRSGLGAVRREPERATAACRRQRGHGRRGTGRLRSPSYQAGQRYKGGRRPGFTPRRRQPGRTRQRQRPSAQELGLRRRDPPAGGRPCWVKSEMDQSRPPPAQPQNAPLPSFRRSPRR